MPRIRRPGIWFVVSIVLAAAAFTLASGIGTAPDSTASVLVAARPIPAGTLLDAAAAGGLLGHAPVPADLALVGMLTDPAEGAGRRVVAFIAPGEPITQASLGGAPGLTPAPLAAGERAVAVPLRAAGSLAAAPPPGARVDVLASDGEGLAGRTRVVVSAAEVLAVMRAGDGADGAGDGALLLRLGVDDALEVARALDFAREVRVVIRPGGEP